MKGFALAEGAPVVVYLQQPKEKIWGILIALNTAGIVVRGLDLRTFEDWLRQEVKGEEPGIGLATLFYPMGRVERVEGDESVGPIEGYADRFLREVGRTVGQALGLEPPDKETPN